MTVPSIILNSDEILLSETTSTQGIIQDDTPFLFGSVQAVNDLDDDNVAGSVVFFDPTNLPRFSYGGNIYYLTPINRIRFTEIPPA